MRGTSIRLRLLLTATAVAALCNVLGALAGGIVAVVQPGLQKCAPGDDPVLYVTFRNDTTNQLVEYLPDEGKVSILPNGMVIVSKDGARLPFLHPPEIDYDFGERTTLKPGETFTMRIPLKYVAKLPTEQTGVYEVLAQPQLFFRGALGSNTCQFSISPAPSAEPTKGIEGVLQRPDWERKAAFMGGAATKAETMNLVESKEKEPLVRARAVRLHMFAPLGEEQLSGVEAWGKNGDAVLGLEIVDEARKLKDAAKVKLLQACLQNRDLAVRRRAASYLASCDPESIPKAVLRQGLEREKDDILLRLIRSMLVTNQPITSVPLKR